MGKIFIKKWKKRKMNNIKKLVLYSLDCIKTIGRMNSFLNLKKDEILFIDGDEFKANEKRIVEIMTKYALNKTTMTLLKGKIFVQNEKILTPLIYCEIELKRESDKIIIEQKNDYSINYSLISLFLENKEEIIENVVNQLNELENIENIDLISILKGLIPTIENDLTFKKDEKAIILTKNPESTVGVINELNQIAKMY